MPTIRVGGEAFQHAFAHYVEDSGVSLCGKTIEDLVEPPNKTEKPEACETCLSMSTGRPEFDREWFVDEVVAVRDFYG